jgi:hypothetical protein
MGTRSLTAFIMKGKQDIEFATMYRQFDGYPSGHGVELAEFIGGQDRMYNGIGCLAAQVVAHFKITREVGGIYLEIPASRGYDEEYIYEVYANSKGQLMMSCFDVAKDKTVFVGTPEKFIAKYKKVEQTA